jgi:hypothetical protein
MHLTTRLGSLSLVAMTFAAAGCGGGSGCNVSGKITLGGEPLKGGQISFVSTKGNVMTANLGDDGAYTLDGLTPGEMTVLIFSPPPPPVAPGGQAGEGTRKKLSSAQGAPAGGGQKVPEKYSDAATSDLKCTLKAGPNTFDKDLPK